MKNTYLICAFFFTYNLLLSNDSSPANAEPFISIVNRDAQDKLVHDAAVNALQGHIKGPTSQAVKKTSKFIVTRRVALQKNRLPFYTQPISSKVALSKFKSLGAFKKLGGIEKSLIKQDDTSALKRVLSYFLNLQKKASLFNKDAKKDFKYTSLMYLRDIIDKSTYKDKLMPIMDNLIATAEAQIEMIENVPLALREKLYLIPSETTDDRIKFIADNITYKSYGSLLDLIGILEESKNIIAEKIKKTALLIKNTSSWRHWFSIEVFYEKAKEGMEKILHQLEESANSLEKDLDDFENAVYRLYPEKKLITVNKENVSIPGINTKIFFNFGHKPKAFELQSVKDNFVPLAIVSYQEPFHIDSTKEFRQAIPFAANKVDDLLKNILPNAAANNLPHNYKALSGPLENMLSELDHGIQPYLIGIKPTSFLGEMVSIIPQDICGIELVFPEDGLLNISKITLFFIDNDLQHPSLNKDYILGTIGIGTFGPYAANNDKDYGVLDKNISKDIINNLRESIAQMGWGIVGKLTNSTMNALANSTLAYTITPRTSISHRAKNDAQQYGLSCLALDSNTYAFYLPKDTSFAMYKKPNPGLELAHKIKEKNIPVTQNMYLQNKLLHYRDADILFIYQFEGYLRHIKQLNVDNSLKLPLNIPRWYKVHQKAFDTWVKDRWPQDPRPTRFETDKNEAQPYLSILNLSKNDPNNHIQ